MEKKTVTPKKPTPAKTTPVVKKPAATPKATQKYVEAVGRRKTSVARVRLYPSVKEKKGGWDVVVNERPLQKFFAIEKLQRVVVGPFDATGENISVTALVKGGGASSQAEAIRLGIARALIAITPAYRSKLKGLDYLKRDPRMVERKKFGSRKARRPQQWRKR
jgi:small subunit ribosomal protein S9